MSDKDTPKMNELEKGLWLSFIKQIKTVGKKKYPPRAFLAQVEQSYVDEITHWRHEETVRVNGC